MMGDGQKTFGSSENGSIESLTDTVHSNGLLTRIGSIEEAFGNSKPINYILKMLMPTTTTSKSIKYNQSCGGYGLLQETTFQINYSYIFLLLSIYLKQTINKKYNY